MRQVTCPLVHNNKKTIWKSKGTMFGPSYQHKSGLPVYTFSVVTLWHTLLTIFSCWSQRPTALSGSDLGRLPRYRRIAKSLNFSRKLKIPCCHNTLIMLACFAVWWVTGEVSGGWGEGLKSITKWISSTWTALIPLSGPVHKYPDIFQKGDFVSPLRPSTRKRRFRTPWKAGFRKRSLE